MPPQRRALRVSAGEGVSGCRLSCAFHNGKVRVKHLGARNAEGHLQNLNANRSCKAGKEQIESPLFIDAPKEHEREHNKKGFFAKKGNKGHQCITNGCANAF